MATLKVLLFVILAVVTFGDRVDASTKTKFITNRDEAQQYDYDFYEKQIDDYYISKIQRPEANVVRKSCRLDNYDYQNCPLTCETIKPYVIIDEEDGGKPNYVVQKSNFVQEIEGIKCAKKSLPWEKNNVECLKNVVSSNKNIKSTCKQITSKISFYVFNATGAIVPQSFEFPVWCQCVLDTL